MLTAKTVRRALQDVLDPGLLQSIVDLGLVYDVAVDWAGQVVVTMTLTTPHCPWADQIVADVRRAVLNQPGVTGADVRLVWSPPWTPYRMSADLKAQLGLPAEEPAPPGPRPRFRERLRRRLPRRP